MTVITGPFDFFTTSRSGDKFSAGAGAVAAATVAFFSSVVHPVMTAAAAIAALRMRNARLSAPDGASCNPRSCRCDQILSAIVETHSCSLSSQSPPRRNE